MAQVIGLSANPTTLIEDEGTLTTLTINLSEPPPAGGLIVTLTSDMINSLGEFDVFAAQFNGAQITGVSDNTDGFTLRITSQTATISLPVFPDSETEGNETITFSLQSGEGFTIDPAAAAVAVTIQDTATPAPSPSPSPTPPPSSGLPLVSLNTGPDFLVESEGTVSAHVFNITGGTIPAGGLVVSVSAPNLSEFDLSKIKVSEGGEIIAVRSDGFDIRLTDFTVLVDLPIANDGETEGLETASFGLAAGEGYEVNSAFSSGEFTLVDTRAEVPANFSEPNDTIPLAQDIGLSPDNPQVKIIETLEFNIGNRYQNADGSLTYVDASEDVDFYKFALRAGDIVSFDVDSLVKENPAIADFAGGDFANGFVSILRLFDAEGNELKANTLGQAPRELFTTSDDSYFEFAAPTNGTYYLGVSAFPNGATQRFALSEYYGDLTYAPFVPASGDGDGFGVDAPNFGEYQLEVILNPKKLVYLAEQRNQSNNIIPETIDLAQDGEPTVSLNFSTATFAATENPRVISGELNEDDLINGNVIEGYPVLGSALNLMLTTEGDIPEEGILVNVNSDSYLRDYFTARSLNSPPFTPGSELVDVIADDTGRETGFQLRIFEPATFITLSARTPYWGDEGLVEAEANGLQPKPETDGPEQVTFFLEGGEGYGVSETANRVTPTFYDSEEQAPEPSVIPEVSLTISETELIESEGTETTLSFSISEAPPEEGVLVYVKGAAGVLPQFDVLNADVTGGVYPTVNGDTSGFYFKITEPEASITLTPFADPFDEGLQSYSLALQSAPMYTIANDAGAVNFTIADNPDSVLEVSLSSDSVAIKSDNTAGLLTFNLTANPPEEGVTVTVNADNLSEFDVEAFTVTGGEITEITNAGFSLNITDATATVELPPLSDDEAEGVETATFSLVSSADYLIDPDAPQATVILVDIPEQVPSPTEEFASNNTISEALALNLNPSNTTATIRAALNSREPGDFSSPAFGVSKISEATEDVDFYSFELKAGDTVKLDVNSIPVEFERYEGVELKLDSELRLFDAAGNELASVNNAAAPGEEFSRDPYLEFTASEAGTYYVGVSQLGHNNYDPLVEDNLSRGSGWIFPEIGVYFGEYDLNVSLTAATNPPPTEPPVTSNQTLYGTDDAETLTGDDGNDTLYGNGGIDTLTGGNGDDLIYGGSQMDTILGDDGNDTIYANGGGDTIDAGTGMDTVWLGAGKATITLNAGEGYVTVKNFQLGETQFQGAGSGLSFSDSADGVKISKGDDLLAVVTWQTASTFSSNAAMIFV